MMDLKTPRATNRRRVAQVLRQRGWQRHPLGRRIVALVGDTHPWWDWGHRLMALVGQDEGGNWSEPQPTTWWYRLGPPKRMWRTGFLRHPLSTYEIISDYQTYRERVAGLTEDQLYEWQAMSVNQDGDLILGHRYWGGNFYGLRKCDVALLRRYLRRWQLIDWFGVRSWLYALGLNAAVHCRKPFACNAAPHRDTGGYDHWHCQLKRRHDGMHRFNNYVFGEINGEPIGVHRMPEAAS